MLSFSGETLRRIISSAVAVCAYLPVFSESAECRKGIGSPEHISKLENSCNKRKAKLLDDPRESIEYIFNLVAECVLIYLEYITEDITPILF